ncbi:hypothetical protein [Leucobacter tardus]|uniref:Uncharacterized protein n=1 Tax=Leucobacter tardus TaxID=501483 RepID=A0A939QCG5_9MICO|nr:hypothetical protein [Leucobacter tardus]MBO2989630.1 hypothetical protein [Leucobacter tardus]
MILPHADPPGVAASRGHMLNVGGWMVGTFISSNGAHTYCVEPGTSEPVAAQQKPRKTGTLPGYSGYQPDSTGWNGRVTSGPASGETVRRMNYVMWKYGRTTDAAQAASVQFAVWFIRDDPGVREWLNHRVKWVRDHGHGAVISRAQDYAAEARQQARAPQQPKPGALKFSERRLTTDASGVTSGSGVVAFPAGTTKVTISGAVFAGGKTVLANPSQRAGRASWTVPMHAKAWQRHHEVSASATWEGRSSGWPASVVVHPASQQNQQWLGSGVSPVNDTVRADLKPISTRFDSQFAPELSTEVPERIVSREAGAFADTVTIGVTKQSAPWPARRNADEDIEYVPIRAEGTLYGPFEHPLKTTETPPDDAPIAARAEVTADRGPGTYDVAVEEPPQSSGYYSWVWEIRNAGQTESIRASDLLPESYRFADRFGLAEEGHAVPTSLRWETQLIEDRLGLDDLRIRDRITPSPVDGPWLRGETGGPLDAVLTLTAYLSPDEPQRAAKPPAGATVIGTSQVQVSADGETVEAEPIPVPFETRGWVTVQTCLREEDQVEAARGLFEEWCDDYGIPAETAVITPPEVVTEAQPSAVVGEQISDTAIVEGRVPEHSEIGFTYYLEPEAGAPKYDEHWRPRTDAQGEPETWGRAELRQLSDAERCLAQPVGRTDRVPVTEAGRVSSPGITAQSAGTGYWVEDLQTRNPDTDEPVELHRGTCGLENERTVVSERSGALADTGSDIALVGVGVGGALGILAGLLLWAGRRSHRFHRGDAAASVGQGSVAAGEARSKGGLVD